MLKTSIGRKAVLVMASALYVCVGIMFPAIFVVWAILSAVVGSFVVGVFLYDWVVSADEVLEEKRQDQIRERALYQATPSTPGRRGKYQSE